MKNEKPKLNDLYKMLWYANYGSMSYNELKENYIDYNIPQYLAEGVYIDRYGNFSCE